DTGDVRGRSSKATDDRGSGAGLTPPAEHDGSPTSPAEERRLHVLIIEDSPDDAELVLRELRRNGYDVTHRREMTAEGMRAALDEETWDIVVSDYSLPTFSGPEAFAVLAETGLDLPFIIVSGTIGEDAAVDALKAGAHDFIAKQRLARLVPAVLRERREHATRQRERAAEQALRASEARFRAITETVTDGIVW